jgi:multidrug efflux pump subunit AcrA (membrane-fusion protein)
MRRLTHSLGVVLLLMCAALSERPLLAGDFDAQPNSVSRTSAPIVLTDCRVKLIDEVVLASQRFGIVDAVVAEGMSVKRNTVIMRLDDRAAHANIAIVEQQAKNDVEVRYARKASELAEIAYLRSVSLNQRLNGSVSDYSLREQKLAAEKGLLQLEQAEHNFAIGQLKLQEAMQNLATFQVLAPFDGLVRKVLKKRGEAIHEGEPIAELVATDRVVVEGFVKIDEADRISVGTPVEVISERPGAAPSQAIMVDGGRVAFVDVKVEPVTRKLRITAEVPNRDNRLRDGLPAQMTILADRRLPSRSRDDFTSQTTPHAN